MSEYKVYCEKCSINYDEDYLYEINGAPICHACAPVMCGDHIVPVGECGCKL